MKRIHSQHLIYLWGIFLLILMSILTLLASCDNEEEIPDDLPVVDLNLFGKADSLVIAKKAEELDKKFQRLVKLTGFNGAVLYTEKGKIILKKAYGYQNVRRGKEPLRTSDPFQLASVSKMFTAMSIMMLKNDHLLDLQQLI